MRICAQVSIVDIGGGLPVNFDDATTTPNFHSYAQDRAFLQPIVPLFISATCVAGFGRCAELIVYQQVTQSECKSQGKDD